MLTNASLWNPYPAFRDEAVAEPTGGFLAQSPVGIRRPERGEFVVGKTCAHADDGIVLRDGVATHEPEPLGGSVRERRAARLARDEQVRSCCGESQQGAH